MRFSAHRNAPSRGGAFRAFSGKSDNAKNARAVSVFTNVKPLRTEHGGALNGRIQYVALMADLDADARNLQLNAGFPLVVAPAVLVPAISATLGRDSITIPDSGFDTLLLANGSRALLPAYAIGPGLWTQCRGGQHGGGDRKGIEYHPHEKIPFEGGLSHCNLDQPHWFRKE
jgi:hypothetical protein